MQHPLPDERARVAQPFPTDPAGLPEAARPAVVELADGDTVHLAIGPVAKRLGDATVRMLAYNESIPGPTLEVLQGSQITVDVTNNGDTEATVHWHGLRLENRYDGVPHETQAPIPVGGSFTYRLSFPDPGVYWYHPHVREDYGLELGLYGNILVVPADPDYWPPASRDVVLTLDDILIEDGKVAPFDPSHTTYTAMGRYGNLMLVGGEPEQSFSVRAGEVTRLWLTNTANSRVFNVRLAGARMKLVGGDSGRVEHEERVDEVLLAPSERAVVDVLFDRPGRFALEHRTPDRSYPLATVTVTEDAEGAASPSPAREFENLRVSSELVAERLRLEPYLTAEPDKVLSLVAEMDFGDHGEAALYACPMHPDVASAEPGHCPRCGMKLLPVSPPTGYACPMHPDVASAEPGHCPRCGMKLLSAQLVAQTADEHTHHGPDEQQDGAHETAGDDHAEGGIEWEDHMAEVNRLTTTVNTVWKLIDRTTGAENADIDWRFRVGEQVKIRLVNEMDSDHPMHHPFHIHGAGRFLVLARDGIPEPNLVWKDTVLVRTGQTVDILFDASNPGLWMAHCHIAEHAQSGMMFSFHVARDAEPVR